MLLRSRNFLPLWLSAVLGAMNDNLVRAAIVVMAITATVGGTDADKAYAAQLALAATGLLMLPFFLFSAWSGALADRYDKATLMRWSKGTELALALVTLGFFVTGLPLVWALGLVFLTGVQSAFFGPIKQGWLPERLPNAQLVQANALMDAGTQLSIVAGTVVGGVLVTVSGPAAAGWAGVALAVVGFVASLYAPKGDFANKAVRVPLNPFAGNIAMSLHVLRDPALRTVSLMQNWFWGAGAVAIALLPTLIDTRLIADPDAAGAAATPVMALFSIGVAIGAVAIAKMLGRSESLWPVPAMAFGLAGAAVLTWVGAMVLPEGGGLESLWSTTSGAIVVAGIVAIAAFGGAFVVPLHAALQRRADPERRAQLLAGFNVLTSGASVLATVIAMGLMMAGLSPLDTLGVLAAVSILMAVLIARAMPRESLQGLFRIVFFPLFRVEVTGREHLSAEGPIVFAPNHVSLLDGPLVFGLLERPTAIAVDSGWANGGLLKRLKNALNIAPIDPQRPLSAKALAKSISEGGACVIFPEGRITVTGAPMKVNQGAAWLVDAGHARVVAIHIEGLERSKGAKANTGWKRIWLPKVRVTVGAPRPLGVDEHLRGKVRRERATASLRAAMEDVRFEALNRHANLVDAVLEAQKVYGPSSVAYRDIEGLVLTRKKLGLAASALALALPGVLGDKPRVGVLLPAAPGAGAVMLAFWRMGRTPALLNPTVGATSVRQALLAADADTVLSSKAFIEKGKFAALVEGLEAQGIRFVWTEDVRASITTGLKLRAALGAKKVPAGIHRGTEAAVLFTSGTEGAPKGVVLTHGNLLANVAQLRARTDLGPNDRALSALPLFHSFGLTAGMVLPLLAGIETGLHPSPLHYRLIPLFAGLMRPTLMFGTDTFLQGWARRASPEDFASLRAVMAGAEPVKSATRELWAQKFGVRVLEGYGATECGPVLALTTPAEPIAGSVGRLLPGMSARLEHVPGVEGGRLSVTGPNVMAGYVKVDNPGVVLPPEGGWYDTGDVVTIDTDGLIRIVGRVKRFAKIAGEMVPLGSVEAMASKIWPDASVAAVNRPDPKTGERVVLAVSGQEGADRTALVEGAKAAGVGAILVPSKVIVLDKIPMLASGKIDYPTLTQQLIDLGH
jgi:acyl-[acyl-carrier-protein]-phospholipid O-acyltransferase / long-chain-fatty-acid--[acyl-carrier-protein] ligase